MKIETQTNSSLSTRMMRAWASVTHPPVSGCIGFSREKMGVIPAQQHLFMVMIPMDCNFIFMSTLRPFSDWMGFNLGKEMT